MLIRRKLEFRLVECYFWRNAVVSRANQHERISSAGKFNVNVERSLQSTLLTTILSNVSNFYWGNFTLLIYRLKKNIFALFFFYIFFTLEEKTGSIFYKIQLLLTLEKRFEMMRNVFDYSCKMKNRRVHFSLKIRTFYKQLFHLIVTREREQIRKSW